MLAMRREMIRQALAETLVTHFKAPESPTRQEVAQKLSSENLEDFLEGCEHLISLGEILKFHQVREQRLAAYDLKMAIEKVDENFLELLPLLGVLEIRVPLKL
jgi:hypothetical protein